MTICFILSWAVYGITSAGPLPLIYLLAIIMALIMSSLGLIISNYSDTMQQAMLVMWFCMVGFILLSGLFTPVRSMPDWAQALTLINPMRYFIDGMRTVFIRGGNIISISHQLLSLSLFATVMSLWSVWSYKKNNWFYLFRISQLSKDVIRKLSKSPNKYCKVFLLTSTDSGVCIICYHISKEDRACNDIRGSDEKIVIHAEKH